MANRFVSHSMSHNNIRFKLQIGNYSMHADKGYYVSPKFGAEESRTKWSLLVYVNDGADRENFIDVRLKRDDRAIGEHYVKVKTSIVSCIGYNTFKNEENVLFRDSNEAQILTVAKENLDGCFGLKKFFYLPNDTLTLLCELEVHQTIVAWHHSRESFQNGFSSNESSFSECFAHSYLVEKYDDQFFRQIKDFSVYAYGDRIISTEYRSESLRGEWSLVVYPTRDDISESLDIRLIRRNNNEQQLVKVILYITDSSDNVLLPPKEKTVLFYSSREVELLSLTDTVDSFKDIKKRLMPNDTLTLCCRMILLEQHDNIFDREEHFDNNIETYGYSKMQLTACFASIPVILVKLLYPLLLMLIQSLMPLILNMMKEIFYVCLILGVVFFMSLSKKEKKKYKKTFRRLSCYVYESFIEERWNNFKQNCPRIAYVLICFWNISQLPHVFQEVRRQNSNTMRFRRR